MVRGDYRDDDCRSGYLISGIPLPAAHGSNSVVRRVATVTLMKVSAQGG